MSRKYLNDRWCARCGRKEPTPYLRKHIDELINFEGAKVLDIGCGNGRNSIFMTEHGYDVTSIDMCNDFGTKIILGKDPFPKDKYDIILANYILMFLNEKERSQVYKEINKNSHVGTMFVVEMYAAKDANKYDLDDMVKTFKTMGWTVNHKIKDKFIMSKEVVGKK